MNSRNTKKMCLWCHQVAFFWCCSSEDQFGSLLVNVDTMHHSDKLISLTFLSNETSNMNKKVTLLYSTYFYLGLII